MFRGYIRRLGEASQRCRILVLAGLAGRPLLVTRPYLGIGWHR